MKSFDSVTEIIGLIVLVLNTIVLFSKAFDFKGEGELIKAKIDSIQSEYKRVAFDYYSQNFSVIEKKWVEFGADLTKLRIKVFPKVTGPSWETDVDANDFAERFYLNCHSNKDLFSQLELASFFLQKNSHAKFEILSSSFSLVLETYYDTMFAPNEELFTLVFGTKKNIAVMEEFSNLLDDTIDSLRDDIKLASDYRDEYLKQSNP